MNRVEKQVADFMSQQNDRPGGHVSKSYIICSAPRVGSNMLANAIASTGHGGMPFEYLNPMAIKSYLRRSDSMSISIYAYLEFLFHNRVDADGVFGIKVHYHQLASAIKTMEQQREFLSRFDYIILLRRKSKLLQAISNVRALETGVWYANKQDTFEYNSQSGPFDSVRILESLAFMIKEDRGWTNLFSKLKLSKVEVHYEDLISSFSLEVQKLLNYLCIPVQLPDDFKPSTTKIGDSQNLDWERQFKSEILGANFL